MFGRKQNPHLQVLMDANGVSLVRHGRTLMVGGTASIRSQRGRNALAQLAEAINKELSTEESPTN